MKNLYIVSFIYAPYQISLNIYTVWAEDGDQAEELAKLYKAEGDARDWDEYEIETINVEGVTSRKNFEKYDPEQGWVGDGECPVEQIFHWSRG